MRFIWAVRCCASSWGRGSEGGWSGSECEPLSTIRISTAGSETPKGVTPIHPVAKLRYYRKTPF
jgi:hypothetical protein